MYAGIATAILIGGMVLLFFWPKLWLVMFINIHSQAKKPTIVSGGTTPGPATGCSSYTAADHRNTSKSGHRTSGIYAEVVTFATSTRKLTPI